VRNNCGCKTASVSVNELLCKMTGQWRTNDSAQVWVLGSFNVIRLSLLFLLHSIGCLQSWVWIRFRVAAFLYICLRFVYVDLEHIFNVFEDIWVILHADCFCSVFSRRWVDVVGLPHSNCFVVQTHANNRTVVQVVRLYNVGLLMVETAAGGQVIQLRSEC